MDNSNLALLLPNHKDTKKNQFHIIIVFYCILFMVVLAFARSGMVAAFAKHLSKKPIRNDTGIRLRAVEVPVGATKQTDEVPPQTSADLTSPNSPRNTVPNLASPAQTSSVTTAMSRLLQPSGQTMTVADFMVALAAKQPTPGGGAAAAVGAAAGAGAALMSAAYTKRKKDIQSGNAVHAQQLIDTIDLSSILKKIDDDAVAYADLQRSWKDSGMTAEEKSAIEARALSVPVSLVKQCHEYIREILNFLPKCNENITSDAKVGIHQLAGAARAAYQTALVNSPPAEVKAELKTLLREIGDWEKDQLMLGDSDL